jgi:hypothetical protein
MPKGGRTTQNGMGSGEVRTFDNLPTDHRPDDFIPQGVWPFSRSLLLYVLAVLPGEVQIELSSRVLEDFFSKFGKYIAQESLLVLGGQFLNLLLDLFNGHALSLLCPYSIIIVSN